MPGPDDPTAFKEGESNMGKPWHGRDGCNYGESAPQYIEGMVPLISLNHIEAAIEGEQAHDVEREPI